MNRIESLNYINAIGNLVARYTTLEKKLNEEYFKTRSFQELKNENEKMYEDLINYENSYANPTYTVKLFGEDLGKLLSAIYSEFINLINCAYTHDINFIEKYNNLFIKLKKANESNEFDYEKIKAVYNIFVKISLESSINKTYIDFYTTQASIQEIFQNLDLNDEKYLFKYGKFISENEIKLATFMKAYDKNKLQALAKTITEAYVEGFKKDNKDMSLRHNVRVIYNIGQELMVQEIFEGFKSFGLRGIAIIAETTSPNKQCEFDHKFDSGIYLNEEYMDLETSGREKLPQEILEELKDYSGVLLIEKFGEIPFIPQSKKEVIKLTEEQTNLSMKQRINKRNFIEKHMPDVETSFCIVAFPSPDIGENFEEIYEDTCKINSMDSKIYEPIHKIIIDSLDKAEFVRVKGQNGNETDIVVAMQKLSNPEKETNFFNCTADVNIPVGEIFTSPQLKGTNGWLHLKKVYLNDLEFIELKLQFIDGYVKEYSCKNFKSKDENKKYIEENLMFPHKSLPLGEFAIGTNTLAYVIAQKHNIVDKLPILIVEKMGPHFAIGDTCYSWAEDLPVYNGDGKEITARDNEHSLARKEDVNKAYTNVHTDITLPYDDLEFIKVITIDKKEIEIIKDGKFVLEGTEYLNEAFKNN